MVDVTERVEEFTRDDKIIVYIDFSGLSSDKDFLEVIGIAEPAISRHPKASVCTITNIANLKFDSHTKEIAAKYMENNKPYVKFGVIIGLDGIKKMMARTVMKLSGRSNMDFAFTREHAIEMILQRQ